MRWAQALDVNVVRVIDLPGRSFTDVVPLTPILPEMGSRPLPIRLIREIANRAIALLGQREVSTLRRREFAMFATTHNKVVLPVLRLPRAALHCRSQFHSLRAPVHGCRS